MTSYANQRRPLWAMRRADRILITLFSVAIMVALSVGVWNYYERTRLSAEGTRAWYRGNEAEANPEVLHFPKSTLELLDVTHPHLFFQTIMFFILCHIFSLTQAGDRLKILVYAAAFGSVLSEAVLPWLIRYVSGAFAPLLVASTAVMSFSILILIILPLKEMWWTRPPEPVPVPPRRRHSPGRIGR